jgi:hypothetical protein
MGVNDLRAFDKYFPEQMIVVYRPAFAKIFGSINASLLLCYLLYWHGMGSKGDLTYKTIKDMRSETELTRNQQDTAIKILRDAGVLSVFRMDTPAKRHFKLDLNKLHATFSSLMETDKLNKAFSASSAAGNRQSNTKTTHDTTPQTTENKNTLASDEANGENQHAWVDEFQSEPRETSLKIKRQLRKSV